MWRRKGTIVTLSTTTRRILLSATRRNTHPHRQSHLQHPSHRHFSSPSPQTLPKQPSPTPNHNPIPQNEDDLPQQNTPNDNPKQRQTTHAAINRAVQSIPYFLRVDPECFHHIISSLPLNVNDVSHYAQHMYRDSLPSFYEWLWEHRATLEEPLGDLVRAGFSDQTFSKKVKIMRSILLQSEEMERKVEKLERKVFGKKSKLEKLTSQLESMKREIGLEDGDDVDERTVRDGGTEDAQTEKEDGGSFWSKIIRPLTDFIRPHPQTEQTIQHPIIPIITPLEKVRKRRFDRLQHAIERTQLEYHKIQRELQTTRSKRDRMIPPLDDDVYQEANRVMKKVLSTSIYPLFARHIEMRHWEIFERYQILSEKTDLTKPHEWYMRARLDRRKIIFHGGPTNSGKTYTALQRLKTADQGLYLGPLRLLAAEIYENLTSQGVYTNLHTGQEKREIPFSTHTAATVELAPLDRDFDVVVIDEIQMVADPFRGFAWTRALQGVRCKEIHVCGGLEALDIVKKIAMDCGDEFELHTYERFSPLKVADCSLASQVTKGCYGKVQPGDCIVAFSRNDIFAIKREIETLTKHKCCIVYGSLPPETRTHQARLFNDPNSGYDILIASDAIGMGLNLSIRRIIFNSIYKFNGEVIERLDHSAIKQISGRAGRRNSPFPNGEVTCRNPDDIEHIRECMSTDIPPIEKAGLLPTSSHIELFNEALQTHNANDENSHHHPLHETLRQFSEMATLKGSYFLCRQTSMQVIAKHLSDIPLTIEDKYTLCIAPVNITTPKPMQTLKKFAQKRSSGKPSGLRRFLLKPPESFDQLSRLCTHHHELELFLWLAQRFDQGRNLVELQTTHALKEKTIEFINEGLRKSETLELDHCYVERDGNIRREWERRKMRDDGRYDVDFDDFLVLEELDEI